MVGGAEDEAADLGAEATDTDDSIFNGLDVRVVERSDDLGSDDEADGLGQGAGQGAGAAGSAHGDQIGTNAPAAATAGLPAPSGLHALTRLDQSTGSEFSDSGIIVRRDSSDDAVDMALPVREGAP